MKDTERAFRWIVGLLESRQIPFLVSGGLAARLYGASRELADIDLDVPAERMEELRPAVRPYVKFGPAEFKDDTWRLQLLTLEYAGQVIDLASAEAEIFDAQTRAWVPAHSDLSRGILMEAYGLRVPVVSKPDLIAYKQKLRRPVDLEDLAFLDPHVGPS